MDMSLIVTSGWHPALHRAEISAALTRADPDAQVNIVGPRCIEIETTLSEKTMLANLSLTAGMDMLLVGADMYAGHISQNELIDRISASLVGLDLSTVNSLRVDVDRHRRILQSFSRSEIAKTVGTAVLAAFPEISVDLSKPTCTIQVVLTTEFSGKPLVVWGRRLTSHPPRRGWSQRAPTRRPFFQPVALDVRVARSLVHLGAAHLVPGESLCDPCSGTGGILIEAALSNVPAVGVDLDQDMVLGARQNLQWIGAGQNHACMFGDGTRLPEVLASGGSNHQGRWASPPSPIRTWPYEIGSLVFDPPYGRNAWTSDGSSLTDQILTEASVWMRPGSGALFLCAIKPNMIDTDYPVFLDGEGHLRDELCLQAKRLEPLGWRVKRGFGIPVHSSMSRLIIEAVLGER